MALNAVCAAQTGIGINDPSAAAEVHCAHKSAGDPAMKHTCAVNPRDTSYTTVITAEAITATT